MTRPWRLLFAGLLFGWGTGSWIRLEQNGAIPLVLRGPVVIVVLGLALTIAWWNWPDNGGDR